MKWGDVELKFNKHGIAKIHKEKQSYIVYNGGLSLQELQEQLSRLPPALNIITNSAVRISYWNLINMV